jgi:hypothetical protein
MVIMSWDQDVSASKLQASSSAERRRFIRATTVLRARLLTPQGTVEATVLDASLNGVKLWTAADVPVGTKVTLLLAGAVHFGGEVAWRRDETLGLCFRDEPERVAAIMAALLPQRCLQVGHA